MTKPENSSIRRSKVGEQRIKSANSRYDRGTAGEQVSIDDWAWCKEQRYGTLICDLERR